MKREDAQGIAAILGGIVFNLGDVCGAPAPDFPTLGPEDWVNALSPIHTGDYALSVQRFQQWVEAYMWSTWCRCGDGQPPGTSTPTPVPPVDSNPGVPDGGGAAPCWDVTQSFLFQANDPPGTGGHDVTSVLLPVTTPVTVTPASAAAPTTAQTLPVGLSQIKVAFNSPPVGNNFESELNIGWYSNTGQQVGNTGTVDGEVGSSPLVPITAPSGAVSWNAWYHNPGNTPVGMAYEIQFYCGTSGPNVLTQPCCPPDPLLEYRLTQILNIVSNITAGSGVNPPVSWHDGARHTALRGAGSFLIDPKAIGMRLEVTTPPSGVQVDPGNPDFYWDMGFITPYALTSPMRGIRLVFLNQSWVIPEFTDQIGYTLKHGTEITAIELLPTTA